LLPWPEGAVARSWAAASSRSALASHRRARATSRPRFSSKLRDHQPPTLIVWGRNDAFFPEPGAHAYLRDLRAPNSASSTPATSLSRRTLPEIIPLIAAFLDKAFSARHNGGIVR
jgi:pimeloyl-ACP methyl ester carboxylesterase